MDEQLCPKDQLLKQLRASYASLDASLTQLRKGMQDLSRLIEQVEQSSSAVAPEAPCRPPQPEEPVAPATPEPTPLLVADDTPSLEDFEAVNPADEALHTVTKTADTPTATQPTGAPTTPERPISVNVVGRLSLAESFFYANELFAGNQGTLRSSLKEMESMSSKSQLYSYLYDTLQLPKDEENVQAFVAFIEQNTQEL